MNREAKRLAIRKALKDARRARRATWEAVPISARIDTRTGMLLDALDDVVVGLLEELDDIEYPL